MDKRVLQNLHTFIERDPYQQDELKQLLEVGQQGISLPTPEAKTSTSSTQLIALLRSLVPLEATPDTYTWTVQMVESSYYPQSVMTPISNKVIKTFIAYADDEEAPKRKSSNEGYRKQINKILQMISTQICKLECIWQEIAVQDQWKYDDHLERAHLVLLLLDDNFIRTKYCFCSRLEHAIQRHRSRTAYVVPIYLRPCLLENVPFATLLFLPAGTQKAVSQYSNKDTAFDSITKGLSPIAKDIRDRILP